MFFSITTGFIGFTRLPCGFIPVSYRFHRFHTPAGRKGEAFGLSVVADKDQANELANAILDRQRGHHLRERALVPERLSYQAEYRFQKELVCWSRTYTKAQTHNTLLIPFHATPARVACAQGDHKVHTHSSQDSVNHPYRGSRDCVCIVIYFMPHFPPHRQHHPVPSPTPSLATPPNPKPSHLASSRPVPSHPFVFRPVSLPCPVQSLPIAPRPRPTPTHPTPPWLAPRHRMPSIPSLSIPRRPSSILSMFTCCRPIPVHPMPCLIQSRPASFHRTPTHPVPYQFQPIAKT